MKNVTVINRVANDFLNAIEFAHIIKQHSADINYVIAAHGKYNNNL